MRLWEQRSRRRDPDVAENLKRWSTDLDGAAVPIGNRKAEDLGLE